MNGRCETDPLDRAVDVCDRCYGEFCQDCLVKLKGRRHPLCTQCAIAASGIRASSDVPSRGSRKTAKARRKALLDAAGDDPIFTYFDEDGASVSTSGAGGTGGQEPPAAPAVPAPPPAKPATAKLEEIKRRSDTKQAKSKPTEPEPSGAEQAEADPRPTPVPAPPADTDRPTPPASRPEPGARAEPGHESTSERSRRAPLYRRSGEQAPRSSPASPNLGGREGNLAAASSGPTADKAGAGPPPPESRTQAQPAGKRVDPPSGGAPAETPARPPILSESVPPAPSTPTTPSSHGGRPPTAPPADGRPTAATADPAPAFDLGAGGASPPPAPRPQTGPDRRTKRPPSHRPATNSTPSGDRRRPPGQRRSAASQDAASTGSDGEPRPPTAPIIGEVRPVSGRPERSRSAPRRTSERGAAGRARPGQTPEGRATAGGTEQTQRRGNSPDDDSRRGDSRVDDGPTDPIDRADVDANGNWIPPILRGMAADAREAAADLPQRRRDE